MPKTNVTITSLAKELELAPSTVSHVLTGSAGKLGISARTQERVKSLAAERGYVPNVLARGLKQQQTKIIGVVFGNLYAGWAQRILEGLLSVLEPFGYMPFIAIHNWDPEREKREIHSLLKWHVDALILHPLPANCEAYRCLLAGRTPLVLLADTLPQLPDANFVGWDSGPAAETAIQHLLDLGRRRIAFLGADHPTASTTARYEAYRRVLDREGLEFRPEWRHVGNPIDVTHVSTALDRFFPAVGEHPDGLFVLNDGIAMSVLAQMDARGIRIPEDVAVVGMGDVPGCAHPRIGLSTMVEPLVEMGAASARAALDLIVNPDCGPIQKLLPRNELAVRSSTVGAEMTEGDWNSPVGATVQMRPWVHGNTR